MTSDLATDAPRLLTASIGFRNDIVKGPGGQQILASNPSSNVV